MAQVDKKVTIRLTPLVYKKGYKYQLQQDCVFKLPRGFGVTFDGEWFKLALDGTLTACAGYAYDGASGPTIDTDDFMVGSLPHDILYQLFGLGVISTDQYRQAVDELLVVVSGEEGMPWWRRTYVYWAVRVFGAQAARRGDKVYTIPLRSPP